MVFPGSSTCWQAGRLPYLDSNIITGQWIDIDNSSKAAEELKQFSVSVMFSCVVLVC